MYGFSYIWHLFIRCNQLAILDMFAWRTAMAAITLLLVDIYQVVTLDVGSNR